jgi:hypothetical protein
MAKGTFHRRSTTVLNAKKKGSESRSFVFKKSIYAVAAAALIVAAGVGLWQKELFNKPVKAEMPAKEIRCSGQNVVVRSPVDADALIACEGTRDAIEFLASQGLDVPNDVAIEIVMKLPPVVSRSAAGSYLESERRVLILVYSEFRKFKTWFGIPINRSLYRSLVSHEVAHLVADYNFKIPQPSIQAKEYIAYITQLSSMEPALRNRVMSHFQCKAFEGDWQMCTTIYMFDCMGFGLRAYRHFLKLANGCEYLHDILNGKALVE